MIKTWIIADTHFGHENVIKYCGRPFKNSEQMDKTIIQNWNNTVKKYDKVYLLGDVSFHHKEKTKEIIQQLNGHKILIKGNHDKRSNDFWLDCGFKEVSKYPIILTELAVILSHEPVSIKHIMGDYFNIHGHIHNNLDEYEENIPSKYKCVSVENIGYTPMDIDDILI